MPNAAIKCPQCGSERLYKDGLRYLNNNINVQRWLCRDCGYRFSEKKALQKSLSGSLNIASVISSNCQGSREAPSGAPSARKAVQTLVKVETRTQEKAAGATDAVQEKILDFLWHFNKQGRKETTIKDYSQKLRCLAKRTNLLDPEAVKGFLAKAPISETSKHNYVAVLATFYDYLGISWLPPKYNVTNKIPFIPTEQELDLLIANTSKTLSALLQLLKETGMRVGEALRLKWTDLDLERKTIRITPEKGSLPRILPITEKAVAMLNRLPKKSEKIFPSRNVAQTVFYRRRKQLASKLSNLRLLKIGFHSFRHWKGTMEYHKTKDIVHVKGLLGHRNIQNTLIYVTIDQALFHNTTEEFHVKTAKTVKEACGLLEVGFEYVTDMDDLKIFRKRK